MAKKKEWKDLNKKEKTTGICFLLAMIFALWIVFSERNLPPYVMETHNCQESYRKCAYDIRIKKKLSEEELKLIANSIKSAAPSSYNIFIGYYLPCMIIGHGSWATSHFTPELRVEIQDYMLIDNPACLGDGVETK